MPGWDMVGPVHDRPAVGDIIWAVPPPPPSERAVLPEPLTFHPGALPQSGPILTVDLSKVEAELARCHIALCQSYMEQRRLTEMLQEALLPWYARLWRWLRQRWR